MGAQSVISKSTTASKKVEARKAEDTGVKEKTKAKVATKDSNKREVEKAKITEPVKVVSKVKVETKPLTKTGNGKTTPKKELKPGVKANTMEELLAVTGYEIKAPQPGQVIKGVVTDIAKRILLVDIGAKTEGMVVDREYDAARDFIRGLGVGDEVTAFVVSPENDRGQILLSLKRALVDRRWEQFAEYLETGEAVNVKGLEVNKGGMIVVCDGIRGFVPSSQFGKQYLGHMEELLNQEFKVKVIEVDKEKNRLIFSERHVSEAEAIAKKQVALKQVHEGDELDGVVSGIMPFGVFVGVEVPLSEKPTAKGTSKAAEVGKVEGLVHISEISWEKVNDPNDYFKLGDKAKVKVLGIDQDAGKLNLSVKQLTPDPWSLVLDRYPLGAKVKGKVSRTAPFGAFVTLEPGVDGLIHISKIPTGNEPKVGEEVSVFVESVDVDQRRMSLGMVLTEVPVGYK